MGATLLWLHRDLRLDDNPALQWAVRRGEPVVPVFIWEPEAHASWVPGAASRWWLHHSLASLRRSVEARGASLVVRRGRAGEELDRLISETGADAIVWNRRYEPPLVARDQRLAGEYQRRGLEVKGFNSTLLFDPCHVLNQKGQPFQVFTPFWKRCLQSEQPGAPEASPARIPFPKKSPVSLPLEGLRFLPRPDWSGGIAESWRPGEEGARARWDGFLEGGLDDYEHRRDRPAENGSSRLSPHLHFGEISPRRLWLEGMRRGRFAEVFLRQLGWRDFAYHLLHHFPDVTEAPLRSEFTAFPWRQSDRELRAWQRGQTGYPIVDAGMRQLWSTGWMHNRVRMLVGSFLVKHLRLHWMEGARWFWDTLVDADLANNTLGWQWVAGCGADAAPYFRIFNPVLQGEKFDPEGEYVRRFVSELAGLPKQWIHKPWLAPAGVRSKLSYPAPIVDHQQARAEALAAFRRMRQAKG